MGDTHRVPEPSVTLGPAGGLSAGWLLPPPIPDRDLLVSFLLSPQTWDEELARSAAAWAQECIWEHGPTSLLVSIGQNLAVHWGR